jgi:hypothetical protein
MDVDKQIDRQTDKIYVYDKYKETRFDETKMSMDGDIVLTWCQCYKKDFFLRPANKLECLSQSLSRLVLHLPVRQGAYPERYCNQEVSNLTL